MKKIGKIFSIFFAAGLLAAGSLSATPAMAGSHGGTCASKSECGKSCAKKSEKQCAKKCNKKKKKCYKSKKYDTPHHNDNSRYND